MYGMFGRTAARWTAAATPTMWHQEWGMHKSPRR
jgi:hypothetical protein